MNNNLIESLGKKVLSKFGDTFTSCIEEKISQKSEMRKSKHEKREAVYPTLFELLQIISDNPCYIFNYDKVLEPFKKLRTELNMYASTELLEALEPFYEKVVDTYKEYTSRFCSGEYEVTCEVRKENGEDELDFEREQEEYMETHRIPDAEINEIRRKLIDIMRKDLS